MTDETKFDDIKSTLETLKLDLIGKHTAIAVVEAAATDLEMVIWMYDPEDDPDADDKLSAAKEDVVSAIDEFNDGIIDPLELSEPLDA